MDFSSKSWGEAEPPYNTLDFNYRISSFFNFLVDVSLKLKF